MYKITCEQLQQVHENCAHSRNKVLPLVETLLPSSDLEGYII